MEAYRLVLRRVGIVLVMVGLADIGYMIYCVRRGQSYSSSFNIFAVIAGVLLWRGHIGAARVVGSFSAFFFAGFLTGAFLLFPLMQPLDLWALQFRLNPVEFLVSVMTAIAAVALMYWIYNQLRSEPVLNARQVAGQSVAPPRGYFAVGAMIPLVLLVILTTIDRSDTGATAIRLAQAKVGNGYKYHVESINWSGSHGRAGVTAYNETEIKHIDVEW